MTDTKLNVAQVWSNIEFIAKNRITTSRLVSTSGRVALFAIQQKKQALQIKI